MPFLKTLYACAVLGVLITPVVVAQVMEHEVMYQGELRSDGVPIDGPVQFHFEVYEVPEGGTLLDSGSIGTEVENGLFNVPLPIDHSLFGDTMLWLEITIEDSDGNLHTLDPRQPMSAAPVAMYALDTFSPGDPGEGHWSLSGSNVYYDDGNVGIGTSSPTHSLHTTDSARVDGDVNVGGHLEFSDSTPQRTAGPIAKATVNEEGELIRSVNIDSVVWEGNRYRVTINDLSFHWSANIAQVTPRGSQNAIPISLSSVGGDLLVYPSDGNQLPFSVVVYDLPPGNVTTGSFSVPSELGISGAESRPASFGQGGPSAKAERLQQLEKRIAALEAVLKGQVSSLEVAH